MGDAEYIADESTMTLVRRRRCFTLLEANRTLPLVKRITADVVRTHGDARKLHAILARRPTKPASPAVVQNRRQVERDLDSVVNRLQGYVDELTEIGAELKDYRSGLIDFVSLHDGREVYLCWKLGEERITHWHELDAGFAGRQPVSVLRQ